MAKPRSTTTTTTYTPRPLPLTSRPLDLFHSVFLLLAIILAFALDFQPFLPASLPSWTRALSDYYATYKDPLYLLESPFFDAYIVLEAVYLVPMAAWCAWGLMNDKPSTPLYLLTWATHYLSSTLVCTWAMITARGFPREDKLACLPGYVIFGLLDFFICVDMWRRLQKTASTDAAGGKVKAG